MTNWVGLLGVIERNDGEDKLRFDTVVAYTYKADIYCPSCVFTAFQRQASPTYVEHLTDTEQVLDAAADKLGIDRYDEHTFDTDDFPKVCFSHHLEDWSDDGCICGGCHEPIND